MKSILDVMWFIPMILCLVISGYLVIHDKDHWGWFILAAVLLCPSSSRDERGAE